MPLDLPFHIGTVHIVGIGGIGMSGYAEVLHKLGYEVQGSDLSEGANVARLRALGIRVLTGHQPENIRDAAGALVAVVVRSSAVKDDNPEVVAAVAQKIPVIPRVDLLAELMRNKWCINISGTHGKTTTTALTGCVLERAGLDPTVINGGIVNSYDTNTRLGKGQWMVVESDESDGTFISLPSVISVITNIDPEHLDHYGSFAAAKKAYLAYAHNLPFYGVAVACIDHPVVAELIPQIHRKVITYGFSALADIQAVNVRTEAAGQAFDVRINHPALPGFPDKIENIQLPLFGAHNVQNALVSFAVGHELGLKAEKIIAGLAGFAGVKRRFTVTGVVRGVTVVDDYAHHPVEIAVVLRAAREALAARGGGGRVIAVMQPHRYSRLAGLFDQFRSCFGDADTVVIADVYAAGEKPVAGIDKGALASGIRKAGHGDVRVLPAPEALPTVIGDIARAGDFVVCLGAGSITQWAQSLPAALEQVWGAAAAQKGGIA